MKAAVIQSYGRADLLHVEEIAAPLPKPNQIIVRVKAASINPLDWKIRKGLFFFLTGFHFPRILGTDFSGEVTQVGTKATQFKPGDRVLGAVNPILNRLGAYAERVAVPAKHVIEKPDAMSYEDAATVPVAGLSAYQMIKVAKLEEGHKVLILGAAGGLGSYAVQIAKIMGLDVTAVCGTKNISFVESLGADQVCDYTTTKIEQLEDQFDAILDTVAKYSFSKLEPIMNSGGIYVTTVPKPGAILWSALCYVLSSKRVKIFTLKSSKKHIKQLLDWITEGKLKPIVGATFPLEQAADAHRLSETGHARGKIILHVP